MENNIEYLDYVDDQNVVIGQATRDEIYQKKLNHRIVHVMVINPDNGEIYLQKRALGVSYLPGYYCTSAAGHVQTGESFEEAAIRELNEEIGITAKPKKVHQFVFEHGGFKSFIELFVVYTNDGFNFNDGEVSGGEFVTIHHSLKMVENNEKIHPQLTPCLLWLAENTPL